MNPNGTGGAIVRLLLLLVFAGCSASAPQDEALPAASPAPAKHSPQHAAGGDAGSNPQTKCVKVDDDPKNCGRCGHDCGAGACLQGVCQAAEIASKLAQPNALTLDANSVYFTTIDDNSVQTVAKTGGAVSALRKDAVRPHGVAVDGTTLYWTNDDMPANGTSQHGGVFRCDLPGCAAPSLVAAVAGPYEPRIAGTALYYAGNGYNEIGRVSLGGGAPPFVLAKPVEPVSIAIDGNHIYYSAREGTMRRIRLADNVVEDVGPAATCCMGIAGHVVLDDDHVYWAYMGNDGLGHVLSASKKTPATRIEFGDPSKNRIPWGVAVDAKNVYWTNAGTYAGGFTNWNGDGQVLTCPKTGCPASGPVVLVDRLKHAAELAVDADFLYVVETGDVQGHNGRLLKIAKP